MVKNLIRRSKFVVENLFKSNDVNIFNVNDCLTMTGFSYGAEGWHHLITLLHQINQNPKLKMKESILYEFHQKFIPQNNNDIFSFKSDLTKIQFPLGIFPWGSYIIKPSKHSKIVTQNWDKSNYCGPSSDSFLEERFKIIRNLYFSIKKKGYQPYLGYHPQTYHGLIGGTILEKENGEKKFIVHQGNHRLAVLSFLGYKEIKTSFINGYHRVIKQKQLDQWKYVLNGKISVDVANEIFNILYNSNGLDIASRYNLK